MKTICLLYLALSEIASGYKVPLRPDCTCGEANAMSRRIVSGEDVTANEYPWIARLLYLKSVGNEMIAPKGGCGGSIISDRNILTAAHCFHPPNAPAINVADSIWVLGMHQLPEYISDYYTTKKYELHPEFHYFKRLTQSDMLIVTLNRKISFTRNVSPICLPSAGADFTGWTAKVAGWGVKSLTKKKAIYPNVLMQTSVNIISAEECDRRWSSLLPVGTISNQFMVCAFRQNRSTCSADSGGPLMVDISSNYHQIVGTISFGDPYCRGEYPAVQTKVADPDTLDWIYNYIMKTNGRICFSPDEYWWWLDDQSDGLDS